MLNEIVLVIDQSGNIRGLYTEVIDFESVGEVSVHRASSVEFNNNTKMWDVYLADGTYLCSEKTRSEAIDSEVQYLQARL
jgi:hypothetical protein